MFTFVVILVLGVLSRQYLGRALRLPYTVILMVLGALTGLLIENRRNAFELNLKSWYDMTPQVILYCFVPILVFESAFMTDTHIFSRQKWQILTLAGPASSSRRSSRAASSRPSSRTTAGTGPRCSCSAP